MIWLSEITTACETTDKESCLAYLLCSCEIVSQGPDEENAIKRHLEMAEQRGFPYKN